MQLLSRIRHQPLLGDIPSDNSPASGELSRARTTRGESLKVLRPGVPARAHPYTCTRARTQQLNVFHSDHSPKLRQR